MEQKTTVNLEEIVREVAALGATEGAVRARFDRLMSFIGADKKFLKDGEQEDGNKKREIWFYAEEKPVWVFLLNAMGDQYLQQLMLNRKITHSLQDTYEKAEKFQNDIQRVVNRIEDEEIRAMWTRNTEALSQMQLKEWHTELLSKIGEAGETLIGLNLTYQEHIQLVQEIHQGIDQWVKAKVEKLTKK